MEFPFRDTDIRDATEAVLLWCQTHLHPRCEYVDYSDPAGKNRDSIKMSAKHYIMLKAREMGQDLNLMDGIQNTDIRWSSVRSRLTRLSHGEPGFLIDPCCELLIEGFSGAYAFKEMVGMPGVFLKKADKNFIANIHDALQYICTRLFLSNDAIRAADSGPGTSDNYDDEEDFQYQSKYDSRTGRSTTGGY